MGNNKLKIFLADLTYIAPNEYMYPYPLGAGYLGAYIKSREDNVDVRIYKDPGELRWSLDEPGACDIFAFSNCYWNFNLNSQFLKKAKELNPNVITVMGGPNIDSYSDKVLWDFLTSLPNLDFYVLGEGEYKFGQLIRALMDNGMDRSQVWKNIPRSVIGVEDNKLKKGSADDPPACDLGNLPSPYLTGLMDKFLDNPALVPIVETNRGCPYTCAYCCWSKSTEVRRFSMATVFGEIEYVARRAKTLLKAFYLADANFGKLKRDKEIAEKLRDVSAKTGFPNKTYIYFSKDVNSDTLKIVDTLKEFTPISMSKQTTNPNTLKIIKRRNLTDERYDAALKSVREIGAATYCELIYGLPGESYESFISGLEYIAKKDLRPVIYPLLLYSGAEMNSEEFRKSYGMGSAHRLLTRYAGTYGDINAAEYEELLISHKDYTKDDYFMLRTLHLFLIIFFDDIFSDIMKLLRSKGLNMVLFMIFFIRKRESWPGPVKDYVKKFEDDARSELISKEEKKTEFTEDDINNIKETSLALNLLYLCVLISKKALLESFRVYLSVAIGEFLKENGILHDPEELELALRCCFDKIPDFEEFKPFLDVEYNYDLALCWKDGSGSQFKDFRMPQPQRYRLEFNKDTIAILEKMFAQYSQPESALYHFRMNAVADRSKIMGYRRTPAF